jgi:hypothetical protein
MSLSKVKEPHRKKKPAAKKRRIPTQRQKGKGGWPDYDERENVFYTPTQTTYAKVLTIRSPSAAEESVTWMREEYKRASGLSKAEGVSPSQKWVNHIHKAMDNTGKRARLSQKRPNISPEEKVEMGKVASIYEKALTSNSFGNYYSAKRMGATMAPSGLAKGTVPSKGQVGDPLMRFRMTKITAKGNRILTWKPYRRVYKSGSIPKVKAKTKELRAAGFSVRVVREGQMRYVYAHTEGRGKFKYQPADLWFIRAIGKKKGKTAHERIRKAAYRKKKKDTAEAEKKARIIEKALKAKARQDAKKKAADYKKAAKREAVKDRMAKARAAKEEKAAKKAARAAKKAKKAADKARMEKVRAGKKGMK